jgi:hypothetical protein
VSYINYGARTQTGAADTTGKNPGNWTVQFTPAVININQQPFEVYKIIVSGASGSTFTVYVDTWQWDNVQVGQINSWDPNQTLLLNPGQTLYFFWSDPDTDGTPPTVTCWFRGEQS